MQLISLTCDQPSFRPLYFNKSGVTLILGDSSEEEDGSSNGVGKTLTLGLVHHCLGAKKNALLEQAVPEWVFTLLFEIEGKRYSVSRRGDGGSIIFNGRELSYNNFLTELNELGVFYLDPNVPLISFRALFKRFARYKRKDCDDPIKFDSDTDYAALLYASYLMGIDCSLVVSKSNLKQEHDQLKTAEKGWRKDPILKDVFIAGTEPKVKYDWLEKQINLLKSNLTNFQFAEDYRHIEDEANQLTIEMRSIEGDLSSIDFRVNNINKAIEQHPDITREDLLNLYKGLEVVFKTEALHHFENIEKFHNDLFINRRARLKADKLELLRQKIILSDKLTDIRTKRDEKLSFLQGKKALDEYAAIVKRVSSFEEERKQLEQYLNIEKNLKEKRQRLREQQVKEDRLAEEYVDINPIEKFHKKFADLANKLYPNMPAGIVLETNTGDNQIRYDLSIQMESEDSDGVDSAKILCFDWLIFMMGSNHTMGMLWHDNRLFAHMDQKSRARWFEVVLEELSETGKQYIASLNKENFDAMLPYLSEKIATQMNNAVVLTLTGDKPENRLLGIKFGKPIKAM